MNDEIDETDIQPHVFVSNIAHLDISDPTNQLVVRFESGSPLNHLFVFDGVPYARFQNLKDKVTTAPVTSSLFRRYLIQLAMDLDGKPKGKEAIQKAVELLASMAIFERFPIRLWNRVAKGRDCIWFDLSDGKGEAVRVTADGWNIEIPEKPMFVTLSHQRPAIRPEKVKASKLKGVFEKFFKLVNSDPDGRLLHLAELVSSFVPDIPHPIPVFHGEHGSAKTMFAAIMKALVDPSRIEVVKLSRKIESIEQALSTHWFVPLDNVSYLTNEQSDLLCIASTGGHSTKRKLYTDGEEFIIRLDSVVSLNGINVAATRPDLLDRCILHELPTIPEDKRLLRNDLMEWFEEVAPEIMGAIFGTLSRAMKMFPKHKKRKDFPRMADFTAWGCSIIDALGYDPKIFVEQYRKNIARQNEVALEEHLIGGLLLDLLEDRLPEPTSVYETSATTLLIDLEGMASKRMLLDKYFPSGDAQLSRELNRLKPNLRAIGILFDRKRTNKNRSLVFSKTHTNTQLESVMGDAGDAEGEKVTGDAGDGVILDSFCRREEREKKLRKAPSPASPASPPLTVTSVTRHALRAKFGDLKPAKAKTKEAVDKISLRLQKIWKRAGLESIDDLLLDKDMESLPKSDRRFLTAQIDKKHVVQEKTGQWVLSETVRASLGGDAE